MKTIWKFPLPVTDEHSIDMPHGAKILTVQVQGEQVFLWALCNSNAPKLKRTFAVIGTGHPIPEEAPLSYIGTFQIREHALVFHVFELTLV